jgi:ribosomal protein L3
MNEENVLLARLEVKTSHGYEVTRKWVRVRGGLSTDWSALQSRHRLLEEARHGGRLVELTWSGHSKIPLAEPATGVLFLAVRATGDPDARAAGGEIDLAAIEKGKGALDRGAPMRRWGERHGLHSHEGGWIYRGKIGHPGPPAQAGAPRPDCALTSMQGWEAISIPPGSVVCLTDKQTAPGKRMRYILTQGSRGH